VTSSVTCTVPQGLLNLPLGPGGALINAVPPSPIANGGTTSRRPPAMSRCS